MIVKIIAPVHIRAGHQVSFFKEVEFPDGWACLINPGTLILLDGISIELEKWAIDPTGGEIYAMAAPDNTLAELALYNDLTEERQHKHKHLYYESGWQDFKGFPE